MKKNKLFRLFVIVALFSFTLGCSGHSHDHDNEYNYEITFDDCTTGYRTFFSVGDLCHGLEHDYYSLYDCHSLFYEDLEDYHDSYHCPGYLH